MISKEYGNFETTGEEPLEKLGGSFKINLDVKDKIFQIKVVSEKDGESKAGNKQFVVVWDLADTSLPRYKIYDFYPLYDQKTGKPSKYLLAFENMCRNWGCAKCDDKVGLVADAKLKIGKIPNSDNEKLEIVEIKQWKMGATPPVATSVPTAPKAEEDIPW